MDNLIQSALGKIKDTASNLFGQAGNFANNSIVKPVENEFQQLPSQINNFAQHNPVTDYFNPQVSGTNGFWNPQNPVAMTMAGRTQLPTITLPKVNLNSPVPNFLVNNLAEPMAESLLNTPKNLVQAPINIARDVNTGAKPQQYLADAAPFAEGMLNIGTMGGGTVAKGVVEQTAKEGLLQGLKQGAITGAKYGAGYGALGGLESGGNINNPLQYAGNLAVNTAMGAGGGALLGGITGGIGSLKGLVTRTPEVEAQLRDLKGKWVEGNTPVKPKGMTTAQWDFQLQFNEKYNRNPYTPVYHSDLQRAIGENMPQPGLSIKIVNSNKTSRGIQDSINSQLDEIRANANTPQEYTDKINNFVNDTLNNANGDKNVLSALRTALNKERFGIAGSGGNYKEQFASLQAIKQDPEMGPLVSNIEGHLSNLDNLLTKPPVTSPGGLEVPKGKIPIKNAAQVIDKEMSIKQQLQQPPEPPRMSQKAINEGITVPTKGSDISVLPQSAQRYSQATPQEQAAMNDFEKNVLNGKTIPNFDKNLGVQSNNPNIPPEKPSFNVGQPSLNPKNVAEQARLASFATKQSLSVRAGQLMQEMDKVLRTPKDNLMIRQALEDPTKIDQYASQATNPEGFAQVAKKINDFYDYAYSQAKGQKVPLGEVKDYFTHIWDTSTPEAKKAVDDFLASAKNYKSGFTKERVINTINEGLNAGLKLKNERASEDIKAYTGSMGTQISANAFNNKINELRPGGAVPMQYGAMPYTGEGKMFLQSNKPGNKGTFIDPQIQKYMKYYDKSTFADNPVVTTMDKLNTGLKELKLAGGLFHALRETVNYAGQQLMSGKVPDIVGGARAFWDTGFARSSMQKFIDNGTLDSASKMGIDVSSAGGIGNENTNLFELMQSKDLVKKATFQRLIPYYILKTVEGLPEGSRTPQVGKQIMALYNGLTNEVQGTNRTTSQLARLTFLAPQFNVGKLINVFSALKPENTPQANFARQALVGTAIATTLEYAIANFLINRKIDFNPQSILSNGILKPDVGLPYKSPTGKALSMGLPGSNLSDFMNTGVGSMGKAGIDYLQGNKGQALTDLGQAGTDLNHTLTSRTAAIPSLVNQLVSGKDYYGNDINIGNLAQSQLPIPAVQVLKSVQNNPKTGKPTQDFRTAALNTAGFRVHNDPNDPANIATAQYFNGLDQYSNTLNENDKQLFKGQIHPTTKDAQGNTLVDKNVYSTPAKYEILLAHPNVLKAEVTFQQSQPNHDPLWDWTPQQRQAYMQAQVISKNDPGGDKATVNALYSVIPQSLFDTRTAYFNNLVSQGKMSPQATNPYQAQSDPAISQFWNAYFAQPQGSQIRKQMIQSPLGQQAMAQSAANANLTNQQRLDMGLPLLASSGSGGGGYSSGGRTSLLASNPMQYGANRIKSQIRSSITRTRKYKVKKAKNIKMSKVKVKSPKMASINLGGQKLKSSSLQSFKVKPTKLKIKA